MLEIKDLVVSVEGKEILHGVNLTIRTGERMFSSAPTAAVRLPC